MTRSNRRPGKQLTYFSSAKMTITGEATHYAVWLLELSQIPEPDRTVPSTANESRGDQLTCVIP